MTSWCQIKNGIRISIPLAPSLTAPCVRPHSNTNTTTHYTLYGAIRSARHR